VNRLAWAFLIYLTTACAGAIAQPLAPQRADPTVIVEALTPTASTVTTPTPTTAPIAARRGQLRLIEFFSGT
jgi:hypothetical protein